MNIALALNNHVLSAESSQGILSVVFMYECVRVRVQACAVFETPVIHEDMNYTILSRMIEDW